jgi:hypothetical protein
MDQYLFLRHFYRYEKARDVPLVFVSYVSTQSYLGIKRIPVGPNGFRFSFMCIFNLIPGFFARNGSKSATDNKIHAVAGFPTKDTWIKAIKNGHYVTWPGVSAEFVSSIGTQKGHLKKQRQNVRSTKKHLNATSEDKELTRTVVKHNILVKVKNAQETVYTDQTGRLPVQSSRGYTSPMVYFDVDARNDVKTLDPPKNT